MAGFSSTWLSLREAADHRSRNHELAEALSARFALRDQVSVVDIGCGTGSNLRAMAGLLPSQQSWTLVDYDAQLLLAARSELAKWADAVEADGSKVRLKKGHQQLTVNFRQADLATDLEGALGEACDLVTAAAFFDLASEAFIRKFARAVIKRKAVFYTVLTYNGVQRWKPHHPYDNAVTAAFHAHQMTDKGLGLSLGPTAALSLSDQFKLGDYSVLEGDSPWELDERHGDGELVRELHAGFVEAIPETGKVDPKSFASWSAMKRTGAIVGHTDTLASPMF
ncbi:MAG: class I SAM-dependent methyltransferase [Alphaproteobacteria bacterium]|nr:class I SAM-dependent methyltransferase [Alphaproteobacteria bacterium]